METLSLYLLTWNVVAMSPPDSKVLQDLLDKNADFCAIGLQEVKSQPQNLLTDSLFDDSWTNSWRDVLAEHNYVKVQTVRLMGIILSLFAKKKHLVNLRNVETSYTKTGLGGLWGNKGAVSVRLNYKGDSFCFVNCHLTPHDNMMENRINDFHTIINSQSFVRDKTKKITDHDFVFWIGDLNFRLKTNSFTAAEIRDLVSGKDLKPLLEADELRQAVSESRAFSGFNEGQIKFNPTYKFVPGTSVYDLKRRPAWTDRILYKSESKSVNCTSYRSFENMTMSDHKPVSALYQLQVRDVALPAVEFSPIPSWNILQSGKVRYTLPAGVNHSPWQWVAIFRENFTSLGEYITYVWTAKYAISEQNPRTYEVTLAEAALRIPGKYVALYMSEEQPYHVLGISEPFEVFGELEVAQEAAEEL